MTTCAGGQLPKAANPGVSLPGSSDAFVCLKAIHAPGVFVLTVCLKSSWTLHPEIRARSLQLKTMSLGGISFIRLDWQLLWPLVRSKTSIAGALLGQGACRCGGDCCERLERNNSRNIHAGECIPGTSPAQVGS